jgi:hypothetical protein
LIIVEFNEIAPERSRRLTNVGSIAELHDEQRPDRGVVGGQRGQRGGESQLHDLHGDQPLAAIEAVGDHTRWDRQEQQWAELGKHQQGDDGRLAGALVDVGR